jgi:hypothetical protein
MASPFYWPVLVPCALRAPAPVNLGVRLFEMTTRECMDAALKASIVPILREYGFKGSLPHFRRLRGHTVDLLTFQFDRSGGGFVIEVARGSEQGITTHWGKHVPASKLTAWDLHPDLRKRVKPREGGGTDSWFRYEHGVAEATQEVLECLPAVNAWWLEE